MKRVRMTAAEEEKTEKRTKRKDEQEKKRKSEDWCFICKDGGKLNLCDREECVKAYHSRCLKKKKLSVPSSLVSWHCSRHTCSKCHDPSTFFCYCCPTALCRNCADAIHFLSIKKKNGFCHKCRRRALFLENEKVELEHFSRSSRFFKEYYEIVKKDEGISLKDLQSPEERAEIKQKHKSSGCYSIGGVEKDENIVKLKRFKGQLKRKLNSSEKSQNEAVVCKAPEVLFASIVSDNIKLVYLKRSLIQDLLQEPESFESKVKGSYVRVESAPIDGHWSKSYQLMQVIGVKKASSSQDTDIKLQLLDMPSDICINSLSDANFSEAECEDLRQKMKVGQLKKPTLDELEEKARSLHKDMTDHRLAREKRALQGKIDYANEKGRRSLLFQLLGERRRLETPSHRLWLLNTPPKVIPELPEPRNEWKEASEIKSISKDADVQMKTTGSPRFIPVDNYCDANKTASDASEIKSISEDTDEQTKNNSPRRFIPVNNEHDGNKTASNASEIESILEDTDAQKNTNGSPRFIPVYNECGGNKTASGTSFSIDATANRAVQPTSLSRENTSDGGEQSAPNPGEEKPHNLTSEASIEDVDLDELLDQLIKPDVSCSSADCGSSEGVKRLEEGLILLLKEVPISDFESMIAMANTVFTCFNRVPINYSSFYERVKNYICCSSLLASTEQFKQGLSLEELAAQYDSVKEYNEMIHKGTKKLSTYINEVFQILEGKISDEEKLFVKFETEHSVHGTERQSRTLREVSEKLKKLQDGMNYGLEPPVKSKKQYHFEEAWEAFVNAKADLGL